MKTILEGFKCLFRFSWLSTKLFLRFYLVQIAVIICLKIFGVSYISDTMTLGAMGFIASLIGIYTAEKIKRQNGTNNNGNNGAQEPTVITDDIAHQTTDRR